MNNSDPILNHNNNNNSSSSSSSIILITIHYHDNKYVLHGNRTTITIEHINEYINTIILFNNNSNTDHPLSYKIEYNDEWVDLENSQQIERTKIVYQYELINAIQDRSCIDLYITLIDNIQQNNVLSEDSDSDCSEYTNISNNTDNSYTQLDDEKSMNDVDDNVNVNSSSTVELHDIQPVIRTTNHMDHDELNSDEVSAKQDVADVLDNAAAAPFTNTVANISSNNSYTTVNQLTAGTHNMLNESIDNTHVDVQPTNVDISNQIHDYDPTEWSPFNSTTSSNIYNTLSNQCNYNDVHSVCETDPSFKHSSLAGSSLFESFVQDSDDSLQVNDPFICGDINVQQYNHSQILQPVNNTTSVNDMNANTRIDEDKYYITCYIPNIDKSSLHIQMNENTLIITGNTNNQLINNQLHLNSIDLSYNIPNDVDCDKITAKYNRRTQIYTIILPKIIHDTSKTIVNNNISYVSNNWPDDDCTIAGLFNKLVFGNKLDDNNIADTNYVAHGNIESIRSIELSIPAVLPNTVDDYLLIVEQPTWQCVYTDHRSRATINGSAWYAAPPAGYVSIGSTWNAGYNQPNKSAVFVKTDPSYVQQPISYELIWNDRGSGGQHDVSIYRPIPSSGYISLGDVVVQGYNPPTTDIVYCVRSDLVSTISVEPLQFVWCNKGSNSRMKVSIYQQPIQLHTFYSVLISSLSIFTSWNTTPIQQYGNTYTSYVFASVPKTIQHNNDIQQVEPSIQTLLDEQNDDAIIDNIVDNVNLSNNDDCKNDISDYNSIQHESIYPDLYNTQPSISTSLSSTSSINTNALPISPEITRKLQQDELLIQLDSLGFSDTIKNKSLLQQCNYSLEDTVEWLLTLDATGDDGQHELLQAQPDFF